MSRQRWRPVRRRFSIAAPAAGAEWTFTNDRGGTLWCYAFAGRFVASAAAANRTLTIRALAGTEIWCIFTAAQTITANQDRRLSAYNGAAAGDSATGCERIAWPTGGLHLPPGHTLVSLTPGIDAGDQYSELVLSAVEYPETLPEFVIPSPFLYSDNPAE